MSLGKLAETKRLWDLGFGMHFLRPRSKVPVKGDWTNPKRDNYETLKSEYQSGYNIGTKLGTPSKTKRGYLAVLDIDVKSSDESHRAEAERWVKENFPLLLEQSPITRSGRGNGSRHAWFLVKKPIDSRALYSSPDIVKVHMPSAKPTEAMIQALGKKAIAAGFRLRPAWEVDFMCEGRQVALPPSIHPDTGKEYRWSRPFHDINKLQVIDIESKFGEIKTNRKTRSGRPKNATTKNKFDITDPDETELEDKLPSDVVANLYGGNNVNDRSAYLLTVSLAMVRARFKDSDILGVLTNRDYYLGDVAFEHAKTSNRQRAARWVFEYCIRKAREEADAAFVFDNEVDVYETLSEEGKQKQKKKIITTAGEKKEIDWRKLLDRNDHDKLKPTFKNIKLVISNEVGSNTFIRDAFANRDFYGRNTPWGGCKGEMLTDDDNIRIKDWFAHKYKIEPGAGVIFEVMIQMCNENSFHPVREYFDSLEWDGVPRLNTWMKKYLGSKEAEPYLSDISRKWMIASVARIRDPGCKFDYMPIFQGKQGIMKSTVGAVLATDAWFSDDVKDLGDKDAALNLQGQQIVEMGELSQMRKADVEIVKSFISRKIDKVRPPYGKRMIDSKRQCIFFGTTNQEVYLKDKTGNRRFWPTVCKVINIKGLKSIRDQLWAEACWLYDNTDEQLYLDGESKEIAEVIQASKMVEDTQDIIHEVIHSWRDKLMKARERKGEFDMIRFQIRDLWEDFKVGDGEPPLASFKQDNYTLQMVGSSLRNLGFKKVGVNGKKYWRI